MTSRVAVLFFAALVAACDRTRPPAHDHGAASATAPLYQCPMHPQIIRHEPGLCPICGMTLQRVDDTAAEAPRVAGHVAFTLAAERQQLIGVTQATAEVRPLVRDLRA